MYVYGQRQFCPHNGHDWPDRTRCFWPLYGEEPPERHIVHSEVHGDFAVYHNLPDIDITGLEI